MLTKEEIYEIEDRLIGNIVRRRSELRDAQEIWNYISIIQSFARALIEKIDQANESD